MDKLDYVAHSLGRGLKKVYENYVINGIYHRIADPDLLIETQKYVSSDNGSYRLIDLYLPQLEIAIEVDEGQHAGEEAIKSDRKREEEIKRAAKGETLASDVAFYRIKAYGTDLEGINGEMDRVAAIIKEKIAKRSEPLKWESDEEKLEAIKARGSIRIDDRFSSNREIINVVYGKNYKGYQRGMYKNLWFPVVSYEGEDGTLTDRRGWQNIFNKSHSIIYERPSVRSWDEEFIKWTEKSTLAKEKRITFVKERDAFGYWHKRFAGVFVSDGYDDNLRARIWRLVQPEISIPLREEDL